MFCEASRKTDVYFGQQRSYMGIWANLRIKIDFCVL